MVEAHVVDAPDEMVDQGSEQYSDTPRRQNQDQGESVGDGQRRGDHPQTEEGQMADAGGPSGFVPRRAVALSRGPPC